MCVQIVLDSCQNEESETVLNYEMSKALVKDFIDVGQDLSGKPIVSGVESNSGRTRSLEKRMAISENELAISVDFPSETSDDVKNLYAKAGSLEDLIALREMSHAVYTYGIEDPNGDFTITVSKNELNGTMNPMIARSRKYLKEVKGFTDAEIQQMLLENDVDESQLVPLVMVVCEDEYKSGRDLQARSYNFNLFATPCNAWTTGSQVGDCAAKAIGADLLFSFAQSGAKAWSKAAIKKAFKTIAKRALGPVGAAVAVVEFAICMN